MVRRARAPTSVFAVNAGQFLQTMPWDASSSAARSGSPPAAAASRAQCSSIRAGTPTNLAHARQSDSRAYVGLSVVSNVAALQAKCRIELRGVLERTIDLAHRDARAAIGVDASGRVIVALTRFDALGSTLGFVPFGLTISEMAAVMGALGARDAVMLDGGISGQMMVRDAGGADARGGAPAPSLSRWSPSRAVGRFIP